MNLRSDSNTEPDEAYRGASMQAETTRLMTLAKNGDRAAFDELSQQVRAMGFRVAQALVGSRDDALELTQEALLKTYKARETYREGDPFLPWFSRIVRNTCYSFLRKGGKARARSVSAAAAAGAEDEGDWELVDTRSSAPVDGLLAAERAQAFWSAFRKLSARDREILGLRHFRELAYDEIAVTLDIPVGTVMSRLYYARQRLREGLGSLLDEDPNDGGPNEERSSTQGRRR